MKFFIVIIVLVNTVIFGIMAHYSYRTFKVTEQNLQGVKSSIDTTNVRLQKINASLEDKLYGIISTMQKNK